MTSKIFRRVLPFAVRVVLWRTDDPHPLRHSTRMVPVDIIHPYHDRMGWLVQNRLRQVLLRDNHRSGSKQKLRAVLANVQTHFAAELIAQPRDRRSDIFIGEFGNHSRVGH